MKNDEHLYLDIESLFKRGWTNTLIKHFLGEADRWESVAHWANFLGKKTFFLERIQVAEALPEFQEAFEKSIKRRKLSKKDIEEIFEMRKATENAVRDWRNSLTEAEKLKLTY